VKKHVKHGNVLVYNKDGELEEGKSLIPDLITIESRLQDHSFWEVDSQGRIYLPVTDAQGLKIVRVVPQ
jgi:hypothetical protein